MVKLYRDTKGLIQLRIAPLNVSSRAATRRDGPEWTSATKAPCAPFSLQPWRPNGGRPSAIEELARLAVDVPPPHRIHQPDPRFWRTSIREADHARRPAAAGRGRRQPRVRTASRPRGFFQKLLQSSGPIRWTATAVPEAAACPQRPRSRPLGTIGARPPGARLGRKARESKRRVLLRSCFRYTYGMFLRCRTCRIRLTRRKAEMPRGASGPPPGFDRRGCPGAEVGAGFRSAPRPAPGRRLPGARTGGAAGPRLTVADTGSRALEATDVANGCRDAPASIWRASKSLRYRRRLAGAPHDARQLVRPAASTVELSGGQQTSIAG